MSSPQAISSDKLDAQIERTLRAQEMERQASALQDAESKRLAAVAGTDGGVDTTSAQAQLGRPLTRQQIIDRLTRLNPSLRFFQSIKYPAIGAVYHFDGITNLDDVLYSGLRHIVGMEWTGPSPEFTVRKVADDKFGVKRMVGQIRGWRMVLQRLIKERLITIEGAEREFAISRGRDSQRWYEVLS
jgi:hypothetical protein